MNHLAHARLSPPTPAWRVGAVVGDFARSEDLARLPDGVQKGVELHRAIDAFTDRHPAFVRSKQRVVGPLHRFAGVLVDVFYDHLLLQRWHELSPEVSVEHFAATVYDDLHHHRDVLPERLATVLPRMVQNRWLEQARDEDGVERVLVRIGMRMRRDVAIERGIDALRAARAGFTEDFAAFWPEVRAFADERAATYRAS